MNIHVKIGPISILDSCRSRLAAMGQQLQLTPLPPPIGGAAPILPWANDWNFIDALHVEQATINADQECALATDGGAQHLYIGGIPTQI